MRRPPIRSAETRIHACFLKICRCVGIPAVMAAELAFKGTMM